MRGKVGLVIGLAAGYVLGTRAGRERYEQIKTQADKLWSAAPVQSQVDKVKDFAPGRDALYFETASGFEDLTLRDLRKGVMITHDGGKVLLVGVETDDLSAGDFLFG